MAVTRHDDARQRRTDLAREKALGAGDRLGDGVEIDALTAASRQAVAQRGLIVTDNGRSLEDVPTYTRYAPGAVVHLCWPAL